MTERFPRISAAAIIKILVKAGFYLSRQSGSHKIYKNQAGKRVTVPCHSGKILHPKVLKNILVDSGLSIEDLRN